MRRGLKLKRKPNDETRIGSHTEFPDEEGTEIQKVIWWQVQQRRHTEFPDEEGTEIEVSPPAALPPPPPSHRIPR